MTTDQSSMNRVRDVRHGQLCYRNNTKPWAAKRDTKCSECIHKPGIYPTISQGDREAEQQNTGFSE